MVGSKHMCPVGYVKRCSKNTSRFSSSPAFQKAAFFGVRYSIAKILAIVADIRSELNGKIENNSSALYLTIFQEELFRLYIFRPFTRYS